MLKQINQWMEPPTFEGDEEKTSQVRIINTLILYLATALLVVIFFLIPIFAFQKIGSWIFSGSVFCVLVAGRHFIFQGRVRFGIILIFSVLYLCILAMLILSGGASNTAMFYFATVVLVAGFFLESHIVNAFTIPTFLAAMAVTLLQDYGLVALPKVFVFNSAFSWIATGLGLLFMIRTRNLFVGNLNDAIETARRTNAEIRAAEARYRVVVEHGGLGVVFMTAGRRIEYASLAYQKILGYSPQEMVGHLDMEFVHPDDLEFAEKRYCELLEKPDGYVSWEYRLQRKDGSYCWVETTAVNLLDDPNVRAIVLDQHDIDERKNAEEALRVSEDQFRAFVEQAPVAIGVFDVDGFGIYANQKFLDMLGLRTMDDVVGRPAYEYFASQFREASKERMRRRALGLPVPTEFESIAVRSNGQEFPVLLTVAPIQVSNGITSIAFVDDITVRKRAEVETTQKNKQLTMLNQLSRELNKLAPLPEILDRISDLIGQVFDNRNLYIALYDETSNFISFPIYWVDGENKSPVAGRPLSKGLTEFIIRTRTPILITNHMEETLTELGIDLIGTPSKCYLGVPVMIDDRGIGVIAVQDYEREHVYTSENIELLETIAFQAAIAIENARLYEASQQELAERKRMEEALQKNERRFRALVENSSDIISILNADGNVSYESPAHERTMGYTLEEMVGINPMTLVHQEDLPKLADLFIEGVQSPGYTVRTKCRMRHKNGTWHTLDLVASNLLTEPAVEGIVINSRDITDQELAEERIRQSEKNYRELFQVNKDGIAIFLLNPIGPPSTFVEINQAAHQMLGYSREEMLKLSPPMLEPFTTQEQMRSRQSVFNTREVCNFETTLLHKNGRRVFAEFTAQMIQYDGRPAIMNIVRDITENKHHQDELRAISALSTALRTAETRAEMLPVIVEQLSVLLNCDSASIEIIDPDTGDSVVEEVMGAGRLLAGSLQKKAVGMNAVISQTRQPYFTNNLVDDSNFIYPDWARSTGIHAGAGVPLIARERLIGFVWMGRKTDITESEVSLLASIGDIAANALYRATLHEQAKKDAADLAKAYDTTLEGWVNALELRDQETEGHTRRVIQMTVEIARLLGICENDLENVRRGALLHDIGKMGIPDSVLLKPGTLDDREWEIMRRHPEYAYQLLDRIEYLRPVLDIPYCHHERWDGTGYPRGLKGEEIPFGARIFAIVDVWDALTSNRPYRRAWEKEKALAHILEQSKKHFDPIVVEAFMKII